MDLTDPMLILAEKERRRDHEAPSFAPDDWRTAIVIKQAEYTRLFSSRFPEVHSVLVSVPGVCVAGGAAALMFEAEGVARGASISEALTPVARHVPHLAQSRR